MKKLAFIVAGIVICASIISAQEVVSSAGDSHSSGGYKVSWTIGEPVIETFSNENNTLTQGFHQTNLYVTLADELRIPGLELKVYPNPTDYILNIQSKGREDVKLQYVLIDTKGKKLLIKKLIENPAEVNMMRYETGNYLLSITTTDGAPVQEFKVIKR